MAYMELRHLRYFIAAAEEEHFGRAADRLHVTRPAISQIIADLEEELGTRLFERLAHHVRLTAAGRALLPQLVRVMNSLNEALIDARCVGEGKIGTLTIGYGSLTVMHSIFREAVKRFREICPGVTLSLIEMSTTQQPKALAEGKIQAALMHLSPPPDPMRKRRTDPLSNRDGIVLDSLCIQTGNIGVAVPLEHRLAQRKSIALEELAEEQFVVVPRSSSNPSNGRLYTFFQRAGFEPCVVQEVSTITSQLALISCGMGVGLAVMGRGFSYPDDLSIIPLENVNYPTSFVLGWVKGERDSILERMIEIVRSLAE
jgi:DNA-binding transcriptional LysR family regulator